LKVDSFIPEVGETVASAFLRTHRSYLACIAPLLERKLVKGMAHITGGGLPGNLSRILPDGTDARVNRRAWTVPPVFKFLQTSGDVSEDEMFRAFNMGIGLVVATGRDQADLVVSMLKDAGEHPTTIGEIVAGEKKVLL
jgi:phosphoribosylformylglycinamidine cyclo-ligase